jgi:pimeloyl-ACP methyl ester carboxylesterase
MPTDGANGVPEELRGATKLAVDAVIEVTDLVEAVHHTTSTLGGLLSFSDDQRMWGISGFVYGNIRRITRLVGSGVDLGLEQLVERIGPTEASAPRESVISAVNGVIGDYLVETDNPLAIPMQFRRNRRALSPEDGFDAEGLDSKKVLVMIHGSCASDHHWNRNDRNHGARLAEELGYWPVYLRYNSGRHISQNGREFAGKLEALTAAMPDDVELTFLGHSMGGLVARSACHYARQEGMVWPDQLTDLICLGAPHHGSPLERYGNWVDTLLKISPYSAPFARLGRIRSAGVTDLRYGNLLDEDWQGRDRFEKTDDLRRPVPLPDGVDCYAAAAKLADGDSESWDSVGDGLVPVDSALGRHDHPDRTLAFPPDHQAVFDGIGHLDLLDDERVYDQLSAWLR